MPNCVNKRYGARIESIPTFRPTLKILIMDDDSDVASLHRGMFVDRGHKAMVARTGEECLKIYSDRLYIQVKNPATSHTQPFDAVILEYKMPDRNGLEVAKEILAISPRQRIIICVTASDEGQSGDRIMELGMPIEVLKNPVSSKVLIDTVEDTEIYDELERRIYDAETFRKACLSHWQLRVILNTVRKNKPEFESTVRL